MANESITKFFAAKDEAVRARHARIGRYAEPVIDFIRSAVNGAWYNAMDAQYDDTLRSTERGGFSFWPQFDGNGWAEFTLSEDEGWYLSQMFPAEYGYIPTERFVYEWEIDPPTCTRCETWSADGLKVSFSVTQTFRMRWMSHNK